MLSCRVKNVSRQGLRYARQIRFTTSSVSWNSVVSPRQEALTLVHKISKFVPTVFCLGSDSNSKLLVQFWDRILAKLHQDLATEHARTVKIVVCGLDEFSPSQDLVSALLADPFSSDESYTRNLNDRWKSCASDQFRIFYSAQSKITTKDPASLALPSSILTRFPVPIEFIELRSTSSATDGKPPPGILHHSIAVEADILILTCCPLVTPLSTISAIPFPSNSILIFSGGVLQRELDDLLKNHALSLNKSLQVVAADPRRAVHGVRILQRESNALAAVQRFQDDLLASRISQVIDALRDTLSKPPQSTILTKLSIYRMGDVLNACHAQLQRTKSALDTAFLDSCALRNRIEEGIARAQTVVFGEHNNTGKVIGDKVTIAIEQARQDMIQTMKSLTWWKLFWKVDEISTIVTAAIDNAWCNELQNELILETGRLSAFQDETSKSAFQLLSKHPLIQTAVLQNQILQLESSPTYRLSPDTLTKAIQSRRNQIINYPTTSLHIAGQRAVLQISGGVAAGVGIGWAGWLEWILGEGVYGYLGVEPSTAVGVGMLIAAGSIRWSVGSWETAKMRWWKDWRRVTQGFETDLKLTLDQTMQQQVTVVAKTASDSVSDLVSKREQEIAEVGKQLNELQSSLDCITAKLFRSEETGGLASQPLSSITTEQ